jgi:hypothetical protein
MTHYFKHNINIINNIAFIIYAFIRIDNSIIKVCI